ncbi:hypothetical protein AAG906_010562 [Vitis piasezkii]
MKASNEAITWEDFNGAPVASLLAKFKMFEIVRNTGIGCPRIHLRLYSIVTRAHGLDEAQMVMFFPISRVVQTGSLHWMYHATRLGMI